MGSPGFAGPFALRAVMRQLGSEQRSKKTRRAVGRFSGNSGPRSGELRPLDLVRSAASKSPSALTDLSSLKKSYFSRFAYCAVLIGVGGFENTERTGTISAFCFLGFLCSRLRLIWPLAIAFLHDYRIRRRVEPGKGSVLKSTRWIPPVGRSFHCIMTAQDALFAPAISGGGATPMTQKLYITAERLRDNTLIAGQDKPLG